MVAGVGGGLIGAAVASPLLGRADHLASSAASCAVTPVAEKVLPSVVTISATPASGQGGSTGSGEVYKSDGYILTNNHVIAAGRQRREGRGAVRRRHERAGQHRRQRRADRPGRAQGAAPSGVPPIAIGSSASLQVGEPVIALGSPLGLSGTVTSGIVSALDRTVEVPGEDDTSALLVAAVQTDAAINPGNSGGALVNCDDQLVGIPSAGATVPTAVRRVGGRQHRARLRDPRRLGRDGRGRDHRHRPRHALVLRPADGARPAESAAKEAGVTGGLFVAGVVAGGPAEQAGLQEGDVITTIDGKQATSNIQLQEVTLTKNPGETVELGYLRGGKSEKTTVTLGEQP